MKTTDSINIDFDSSVDASDNHNNNIMKMGADPAQLYLIVTN